MAEYAIHLLTSQIKDWWINNELYDICFDIFSSIGQNLLNQDKDSGQQYNKLEIQKLITMKNLYFVEL